MAPAPGRRRGAASRPPGPPGRRPRRRAGRRPGAAGRGRAGSPGRAARPAIGCRSRVRPGTPAPAVLVWMDLEMTGLDPARHVIVEIATLVTDDELDDRGRGARPRRPPAARGAGRDGRRRARDAHPQRPARGHRRVHDHARGGRRGRRSRSSRSTCPEPRTVPLCGNSIGTDRRFLAAYLPEIEDYLHYRSVDVSTVKELARRWYPEVVESAPRRRPPPGPGRHPRERQRAPVLPRAGVPCGRCCRRAHE